MSPILVLFENFAKADFAAAAVLNIATTVTESKAFTFAPSILKTPETNSTMFGLLAGKPQTSSI